MDQVWASASVKIDEQALERLVAELAKKGAKQGAGKR
jgi:hypothetical protein